MADNETIDLMAMVQALRVTSIMLLKAEMERNSEFSAYCKNNIDEELGSIYQEGDRSVQMLSNLRRYFLEMLEEGSKLVEPKGPAEPKKGWWQR